jgi:DNA transformation protein
MPVSTTFRQWVREQLEPSVRALRDRSMFGGVGIYAGDLFFALLAEDRLYMKVDDSNRSDFTAAGMEPFRPFPDQDFVMSYYEVPLEVIENRNRLGEWASKAIEVAKRTKKPKPATKSKSRAKSTSKAKSAKPTKKSPRKTKAR